VLQMIIRSNKRLRSWKITYLLISQWKRSGKNLEVPPFDNFPLLFKGGQTAILVRWSAAQRTTEMLADQRQRTTEIELPLLNYLREVI
jgi:hypothetical protein